MKLYEEIGKELGITPKQVHERANKEPIVQKYYEWKYNWDPKDENTLHF